MKYKFVVLLLIAFALTSCEQKINYAGVFEVEALDDDTVRICNCRRDYDSNRPHLSGIVRIPETVYGKKVVEIGAKAFSECKEVMEFIIPNTVRIIDEKAFQDCTSLRKVFIPNSVVKIASDAFTGCSSLKTINFENSDTWKGTHFYIDGKNDITIEASSP